MSTDEAKKTTEKLPMTTSTEKVKKADGETFKYVRVPGEYRFCDIGYSHNNLLLQGEKALSAGMVLVKKDCFSIIGNHSSTLKIGRDADDHLRLEVVLGKPYRKAKD